MLPSLYLMKVAAGYGLFWIYIHYYGANRETADTLRFLDDALVFRDIWNEDPRLFLRMFFDWNADIPALAKYEPLIENWDRPYGYMNFNDNRTLIRVNALIGLISFGNYHVHSVLMNLISFSGLYLLFKAFESQVNWKKYAQLTLLFLFPGILFWSSGVLKESIMFCALGLFLYGVTRLLEKSTLRGWMYTSMGVLLLIVSKTYILILLLLPITSWLIAKKYQVTRPLAIYSLIHVIGFVLAMNTYHLGKSFNIQRTLQLKQRDFIGVCATGQANSYFTPPEIHQSAISFIKAMPEALVNSFFRPFPSDADSVMHWLSIAENSVFILILLCWGIFLRNPKQNKLPIWFGVFFMFNLFVLIGLITPVSGAIVRYKIPAVAIVLLLFVAQSSLSFKRFEK